MTALVILSIRVCPLPSSLTGTASYPAWGAAIRSNYIKRMKRRVKTPLSDSSLLCSQPYTSLCQLEAALSLRPPVSKGRTWETEELGALPQVHPDSVPSASQESPHTKPLLLSGNGSSPRWFFSDLKSLPGPVLGSSISTMPLY